MHRNPIFLPVLAAIIGIGFFSGMDAIMKSASIAIGAYSAFFLRSVIGFAMILPYWLVRERNWPQRAVLKVHLVRGVVVAFMGWSFFLSLIYLPLAEALGLSFISPLIAPIGRAPGRERVCKYVSIVGVAVSFKKHKKKESRVE